MKGFNKLVKALQGMSDQQLEVLIKGFAWIFVTSVLLIVGTLMWGGVYAIFYALPPEPYAPVEEVMLEVAGLVFIIIGLKILWFVRKPTIRIIATVFTTKTKN